MGFAPQPNLASLFVRVLTRGEQRKNIRSRESSVSTRIGCDARLC